ncbi:FIST N-terminal domain-containing protein [Desulfogranum marinum]|uniref:FIST signal transduction protein n=1 Tax=Desulfogranum marinum TaxID=453220 RepID=UPI0029C70142|nr:FIST N-terminal domain-containing protein [Desulfogranum marinum]
MKISTVASSECGMGVAADLYESLISDLGADPDLVIVYCSIDYDIDSIVKIVTSRTPNASLHGGTSCMGAMTQDGAVTEKGSGIALMGIVDPEGSYGVGVVSCGDSPEKAAEDAVKAALKKADRPGEVPAMIWLTTMPGGEEAVLRGIGNIVGEDVPVAGGSSADNSINGEWKQFGNNAVYSDGIVVTVLFPSTEVMFAFHSGYEPTEAKGIITKVGGFEATGQKGVATSAGKRTLYEIDGHPAAKVYNEWVGGTLSEVIDEGGNILHLTTLNPLGRIAGYIGDIPYYQLAHPEAVTPDGAITLFADISKGDEIALMRGTVDSLISRAGRVAVAALETTQADSTDIAGALVVYCAGCMLTVQERLDEVVESFQKALPNTPFLGTFTFGEQGCFLSGENRHGNLMISVLLIAKE